jgi:hypothetical protein
MALYANIIKMYKPRHVILGFTYTIKEKIQAHNGSENKNLESILGFYIKWHIHKHANVVGMIKLRFRVYLIDGMKHNRCFHAVVNSGHDLGGSSA